MIDRVQRPGGCRLRLLVIVGLIAAPCAVAVVDIATPLPVALPERDARRPAPRAAPRRSRRAPAARVDDPNPFVRFGPRLAWWAFAARQRDDRDGRLASSSTRRVAQPASRSRRSRRRRTSCPDSTRPAGCGSRTRPGNVGGSHKARHLVGDPAAPARRRAARPAAVERAAARHRLVRQRRNRRRHAGAVVGWPIDVFVPSG